MHYSLSFGIGKGLLSQEKKPIDLLTDGEKRGGGGGGNSPAPLSSGPFVFLSVMLPGEINRTTVSQQALFISSSK